jgi:replicative DNA helicase
MSVIYNLKFEKIILAGILQYPEMFPDLACIINVNDFSKNNKAVYTIMSNLADKREGINKTILAERLKNLSINFDDIDSTTYIDSLAHMMAINSKELLDVAKELKKVSYCRSLETKAEELKKLAKEGQTKTFDELTASADSIYTKETVVLGNNDGPESVYDDLEAIIEERGNNPIEEFGFMGPFDTINRIYGSLLRPGSITVIGARTGIGKTSFGFYYLTHVAEKYNLPILHLDFGEMTKKELQFRAACMLATGRIPLYYLETGKWREKPEWVDIMRKEVFPRVRKLRMDYKNIGHMSALEIIAFMRRYYYNKVGRGNQFLTHFDYLKPFENDKNSPEWKVMGHFIQDIKTFITDEIPIPFWSSLQLNRSGITGNKSASEIDDTENTFGVSDRITQQTSHSFLLRHKTPTEQLDDGVEFGNIKLINVKARHLGKDYQDHITPVKLPDGRQVKNYMNMYSHNFNYEDRGDLNKMIIEQGKKSIDITDNSNNSRESNAGLPDNL